MKKVVSLLLAVVMTAALITGCGAKNEQAAADAATASASAGAENTGNTAAATAQEPEAMPTTPITFTAYMGSGNTDQWDSPVAKKITELTGVTLKIENSVGDSKQRLSLMAASGDLPDFVFAGTDLGLLLQPNLIEKLDDLIEKYGPNIKTLYGDQIKRLRWSTEYPYIYCLGDAPVGDEPGEPNTGFLLQHAVVMEENYPKLKTVTDWENAIKTYYAKHPTFKSPDGTEQPTIPILLNGYDWGYFISIGNPANLATGNNDDEWAINPDTMEAKRHIITDSNKQYLQWLNNLWNQKLIDKESFTEQLDQYKAKLSSGRVLGAIDANWNYQYDVHPALKSAGMEDRMYGMYPCVLNESYKWNAYMDKGYCGFGSGMAITTKCSDKVRAMQFLNWMASPEAQVLNAWGIEGVHWKYDANGKRVFLPDVLTQKQNDKDFSKKTGIGCYAYPWPRYGSAFRDSTGNPVTPDTQQDIAGRYTETEKKVLAGYGVTMWRELYPQANDFKQAPYGAAYKIEGTLGPDNVAISNKLNDLSKKYCAKLIMAKPGEFDAIWSQFVKDMEAAGVRDLEKVFSQALKDRVELWK